MCACPDQLVARKQWLRSRAEMARRRPRQAGPRALGVRRTLSRVATSYAKQRRPSAPALRASGDPMEARARISIAGRAHAVYKAASRLDGEDPAKTATSASTTRQMAFAPPTIHEIHGGSPSPRSAIEKFWRQHPSTSITEAPAEVMLMVIARHSSSPRLRPIEIISAAYRTRIRDARSRCPDRSYTRAPPVVAARRRIALCYVKSVTRATARKGRTSALASCFQLTPAPISARLQI